MHETRKQLQDRGRGHRARLREKFLQGGLERFSDEEIIEFLLSLGTPRRDVKLQAREALKRFGSLSGVLSASLEDLIKIPGVGRKNGLYLHLVHQVASRYLKDRAMDRPFFDSSSAVFDFLFHTMRDLEREVFKVLLLNRKNQLLSEKDLFFGSISGSAVYPREVISLALKKGAAALVFAHNHPSGDPSPSEQDRSLTRELVWAAHLMGIQVLDHVIIGHNTYYSFADQGLIRSFAAEFTSQFRPRPY